MARDNNPSGGNVITRPKAGVEVINDGDVALVNVVGLVDEHFSGFGEITAGVKYVVINVSGMTRMTSFGVRQWLKGMDALPKTISDLYLLGCPTFFVDQLNMVLNFGGAGQVLTVLAPYTCPGCGVESSETIDVLRERATLAKAGPSERECSRCSGKLEFDETPESYFSFVSKYAASSIQPGAAKFLAERGLYTASEIGGEKPLKIIKLVHGAVTYFRISGTVGSQFRARPFLVGAEGEVVIDFTEVERFDSSGVREWRRLIKSLSSQVPAICLVDVDESFLTNAGDTFTAARNIAVWSVRVPYVCTDCGRASRESQNLEAAGGWPLRFAEHVCAACGGTTRTAIGADVLAPLQKASTAVPAASAKVVARRSEILSRALTDANVAQAGEAAAASIVAEDTILGKYKIVKRLSAGGMAEVFLAKQVGIGGFEKPVALKRIQRQLLETRHLAIDMFLNEAKIAGRLTHPNIVQVLDVGEVGGALYLAMEYVNGKDLRDVVKKVRSSKTNMPLGEALYVVREVAQALHHAYWSTDMQGSRLQVVHRDVSPHNVIISYEGAVKLLDFGVAMSSVTEQQETMIVGKWLYMSPEHTMNAALDHRSDLFSLGVILYLLCTGKMPFAGNETKEIVRKIRGGDYKRLRECAPDLPDSLATLVDRMLAPRPEDRPQTGQEIVAALTDIMRSYGIDSGSTNMAYFLSQLFADEIAGNEAARINELVRISGSMSSVATEIAVGSGQTPGAQGSSVGPSSASFSIPPAPGSTGSGPRNRPSGLMAADVSAAIARRSGEMKITATPPAGIAVQTPRATASTTAPMPMGISQTMNAAVPPAPNATPHNPMPVAVPHVAQPQPQPQPQPHSQPLPPNLMPNPNVAAMQGDPSHQLKSGLSSSAVRISIIVATIVALVLVIYLATS